MIGIDRDTGATVDGWDLFVQRAMRALTTPLGTRQKRPLYGSRLPSRGGRTMGDQLLILAQGDALETFYNPANGLSEFEPTAAVALRGSDGIRLRISGIWKHRQMTFEVPL